VFLGAEDGSEQEVSDRLRLEQTGEAASQVAPHPPVRAALLERQRAFASVPGLVADGRDMGTTVFPSAPLKIYLTASAEERAKRRAKQLKSKGVEASIRDLQREIEARDARDSGRSASPLRPADDACLIDTSTLDAQGVLDQVLTHAAERGLLSAVH
jgi:cytidylate kinase